MSVRVSGEMNPQTILRDYVPGDAGDWFEECRTLFANDDLQMLGLAESIGREGVHSPVTLAGGKVLNGHHRVVVAALLGIQSIPVEHLEPTP